MFPVRPGVGGGGTAGAADRCGRLSGVRRRHQLPAAGTLAGRRLVAARFVGRRSLVRDQPRSRVHRERLTV